MANSNRSGLLVGAGPLPSQIWHAYHGVFTRQANQMQAASCNIYLCAACIVQPVQPGSRASRTPDQDKMHECFLQDPSDSMKPLALPHSPWRGKALHGRNPFSRIRNLPLYWTITSRSHFFSNCSLRHDLNGSGINLAFFLRQNGLFLCLGSHSA